jgi:hypothetical protein
MQYRNLKSGKIYVVVEGLKITNATNDQDGQAMLLYMEDDGNNNAYVREVQEFHKKFEKVE